VIGYDEIDWTSSGPILISEDGNRSSINRIAIENVDQSLDEVLLEAYCELSDEISENLIEELSSGRVSRPARILATIANRRAHTSNKLSISKTSLWNALALVEDEKFERDAKKDLTNELIRIGAIVRDGSDVHVRPALTNISMESRALPSIAVIDE
jgi:NurA-like 5'-3' nuclease